MPCRLDRILALLLLLAAGCGGGGGGGSVTYPQVGAVDGSEDEEVFEPGRVLTYRVTMPEADRDFLEAHGILEEWMPATLTVTGGGQKVELGQVGFRHKGGYGTLDMCWGPPTVDDGDPETESREETLSRPRLDHDYCRKISYKFKFNEYVGDTRFHGLKKLNLHSGSRDPTKLHDMLAYSLFYDFGVDAPRTAPARLYVNGEFMGLFIAVEDVDGTYAKEHYPQAAGGNLYKEVWPDPDKLGAWGEDAIAQLAAGAQEQGDDPTDFVELTKALRSAVELGSTLPIEHLVDVEGLLRYMAVDRAIKNWDGVTAMYTNASGGDGRWPHNFYWYHATAEGGRFHLVPWDMDNTFPYWDPYVDPHGWGADRPVPDWNVKPADCTPIGVWGDSHVMPSGCDPVLNLIASTQWERYEALGRELLAGPARTRVLQRKARAWASLIEPIVRQDPTLDPVAWQVARDELIDDILARLPGEYADRLDQGYVDETAQR